MKRLEMVKREINFINVILSSIITIALFNGLSFYILTFFGFYASGYKKAYRIDPFQVMIIFTTTYWILNLIKEIWQKLELKKNKITLEKIFKFFVLLFLLFLFFDQKYSIRITTYILIPIALTKIYRKKAVELDKTSIFIIPFFLSILLSMKEAIFKKNIFRDWQDLCGLYLFPLCFNQFEYGKKFKSLITPFFLIPVLIRTMLGYFEKMSLLYSPHYPFRVGGGQEVFRYAGILMFGVIYFLYKVINGDKRSREFVINSYGLLITAIVMIWTQNRANWVAICLVGLFFLGEKAYREKKIKQTIILIVFFAAILGGTAKIFSHNTYVRRLTSITNTETDTSNTARFQIWKNSVRIFKENPITGVGFHIKNFAAHEKPENYEGAYKGLNHNDSHNTYLFIAATMGVVGILTYLWMVLGLIYEISKNKNKRLKIIALGMIFGNQIMGFFTSNIIYFDMMGWIIFISSLALYKKGNGI